MPTLQLPNPVEGCQLNPAKTCVEPVNDVSKILSAAADGDGHAAIELLPLVYDELRKLARQKMAREEAGQTLNATALVHEAYMRLVGVDSGPVWDNRGHFFAAAAEAMRRILVENARRKSRKKHGGGRNRIELEKCDFWLSTKPCDVLAIDEVLDRLTAEDELAGRIVKLRYFAGMSIEEAAGALEISRASAYRYWSFAHAWLQCELQHDDASDRDS